MFAAEIGAEKIPVLLVEDSRSEALLAQKQLHAIDDEFTVLRASRLEEALVCIIRNKVDVVLLDLGLPDSDGPQSVKILNEHFPDLPIVILSGRNDPETIRKVFLFGAEEFVSKDECSGVRIRQALLGAIIRKSLKK